MSQAAETNVEVQPGAPIPSTTPNGKPSGSKPSGGKPSGSRPAPMTADEAEKRLAALDKLEGEATKAEERPLDAVLSVGESEILARLRRLEEELEAAKKENAELVAQQEATLSGRRLSTEARPFAPPGGSYKFRVGPLNRDDWPHLPTIEVEACDESEVIRWYCATHPEKPTSNKQLDPARIKLKVECIDRRRTSLVLLKQRLAVLRTKISTGASLSPEDLKLAEQFEAEVYGFPS